MRAPDLRPASGSESAPTPSSRGSFGVPVGDIAVVGAGFVGLIFALAAAKAGLGNVVVDRTDPGAMLDDGFDGRVSAVSAGSRHVLEALDLWPALAAGACPITDIRVSDGAAPSFVHFDHRELARGRHGAAEEPEPLGHIVENRILRRVLWDTVRKQPGVMALAPRRLAAIETGADAARIVFADGGEIAARLLVGADGRNSPVRRAAGINVTEWTYDQAALVTTVIHTQPHEGVAEEHFMPQGPFATLPLTDDAEGRHRSSVVWADRTQRIADFLALGRDDFDAELARRFGDHLGEVNAVGPRWSYPLALTMAESYVAQRIALIGDAAHAIHPIAGQGLNLGIRDAAALAEVVVDTHRLGGDIGMKTQLVDYERWRRFDNTCLAAMTDMLNRTFSQDFAPLRFARAVGLAAMNRFGPARRAMMREAMGIAGEQPRLVRGEKL